MSVSPPSALKALPALGVRVGGRPLAFFLDYDGTLTPIVSRPEDALLADDVRALLAAIAARFPVTVVSGRDRREVERLVGLEALAYVGSHGFDIAGPPGSGIRHEIARELLPVLDAAERALVVRLRSVQGARVERKRFTVAVHYRQVPEDMRRGVEVIVDAVRAVHPRLRREGGKAVFELRPDVDWDKGRAVEWLLGALGLRDAVPVYVGDDLTEEAALAVVARCGVGVVVAPGQRASHGEFSLADPGEVVRFLGALSGVAP